MPRISVIGSSTVTSSVSIAFGTQTSQAARVLEVYSLKDNGTIEAADSTSVVTIAQQGIGNVVISSSTLTVSSGSATTEYRGKNAGNYTIIATSPGKDTGTFTGTVIYNPFRGTVPGAGGAGGGGGAGSDLLRGTVKINNQTLYRIILWNTNTTDRGRGDIAAIIHDAKNIGVSTYLNEGGEIFFTLPYNHPQISACVPLERHYRVDRFDEEAGVYVTVGQGLLEDYDASDNEIVFYGIDYMGVLQKTITTPSTTQQFTYTSSTFAAIYQNEMTQAIGATNSRLGFIDYNQGTTWSHQSSFPLVINSSTNTYSVYTGGEPRASFIQNLANIAMSGTTTKVVFGNTLESDTELYNGFFCDMNWSPTPNNNIVLEYGGNVKSFSYSPNFRRLLTRSLLVATNSGATVSKIWSSVATGAAAPASTYGLIDGVSAAEDIKSQAAADARAAYNLYQSSPDKIRIISIAIKDGSIVPFKRYKLGDDIRVRISRGIVNLDASVTLRGQRYVGRADGSEQLWFDFFIRDSLAFDLYGTNLEETAPPTSGGRIPRGRQQPSEADTIPVPDPIPAPPPEVIPPVPPDPDDESNREDEEDQPRRRRRRNAAP